MPLDRSIQKVLLIGSGPIVIGQAAEFDYAGTQACRVLRENDIEIVLINPNPATIMTDRNIADKIYIEALPPTTVMRIIMKERPDSDKWSIPLPHPSDSCGKIRCWMEGDRV